MRIRTTTMSWLLVVASVTAVTVSTKDVEAQSSKKPNILVIWGDDIGQFNISAYNHGMMGYKTPNIDRIAKQGPSSPTGMASRVVLPVARPSLLVSRLSVPGSRKLDCRALPKE